MEHLSCVEVEPDSTADAAVIWLHGLGADGHDFEPIVAELDLPETAAIRFIFPNAPSIRVSINNGYVMPAWYDIVEMNIDHQVDQQQLMQSADAVTLLVNREIERGIDSRRIVIAGFSQGGAVAYQTALTYPQSLAGLLALSTYFATAGSITLNSANKTLSVAIFHGTFDTVVPEYLGQQARDTLVKMGYHPSYATYAMEHGVCPQEIADISVALQKMLA